MSEPQDAIQYKIFETVSGRTMTDGATMIADFDRTAENKVLVTGLVTDVLMGGKIEIIDAYIAADYRQHDLYVADTREGLKDFTTWVGTEGIVFGYTHLHLVVAEGNFVLTQAEGVYDGAPTALYDLWRVEGGKIAEHWNVVQAIPT